MNSSCRLQRRQIAWEQAMDEIAAKLGELRDSYGPETLAFSRGTYRTYGWAMNRFLNLFGSPNMTGPNHICMCPSHTVEWCTCGSFARLGLEPFVVYREPVESPEGNPELAKEYPLILIATGKFMPFYHSELRQIPSEIREHPDPVADIHPDTARALGISDHEWLWVETLRRKIKQRARLTDEVHPAMLRVQHGWWFPDRPAAAPSLYGIWESNSNILCPVDSEYCNPEVGGWPHTGLLCKVYKPD